MRIAFVGKGGSGKTTLSALFALYATTKNKSVIAVDADLNIHLPELLGFKNFPHTLHISEPEAFQTILEHLRGTNERIKEAKHFRKTTPPGRGSNLIELTDSDPILRHFAKKNADLSLMVVGTYQSEDIGASCYHNNLAVFENVLSHLNDKDGILVADMVAGVDAFANTLHAQFDLLVLVVEPTRRGVEVYEQYQKLSENAGVAKHLLVIANKIRDEKDKNFLANHIPAENLLGYFAESGYLRRKDQEGGALDINTLEPDNKKLLETIYERLLISRIDPNERLKLLWELHRRYVAQAFIRERFGDLTTQIDPSFTF
jgi:CO dehydrogenase maturation factor